MIRSENLKLRALEPADVDLLYEWENDTGLWHLSNTLEPFSRFTLEQYVLNSGDDIYASRQLRMMIDLEDNKKVTTIGCVDLFDFDPANMRAGIGIMIAKEERNKGYASEALELMVDYTFHTLRLHQLYANVMAGNAVSLGLFRKKGFSVVGLKKEWLRSGHTWSDEYMLQLINKNY